MKSMISPVRGMLVILACILAIALFGCEGSDAKKAVTGTVKDLVGQKAIDQGEKMKKDLDRAMKDEVRRLLNMDGRSAGEASEKTPEEKEKADEE